MNAAAIARALNAKKSGAAWIAKCVAHDDQHPSMSISEVDGKVLVKCHAGCDQDAVIDKLRDRGLWNGTDRSAAPDEHPTLGAPSASYDYQDAAGRHVGRVMRFDRQGGKEIRQCSLQNDTWTWKAMPAPRPLYRLPDVLKSSGAVLIVEGEKCVSAAMKITAGLCITTWAGGAKATEKTDFAALKKRNVILWPDNDQPGRDAMRSIAQRLQGIASVRMFDPATLGELPAGWDAADALADKSFDLDALWNALLPVETSELQVTEQPDNRNQRGASAAESVATPGKKQKGNGKGPMLPDGVALLTDVHTFIARFCVFPDAHCLTAVTLWAAHAHMVQSFHTTPRLALLSPEASSGKTRVLEVLDLLAPESLLTLNASPATIFRTLEKRQITLLFDEVDAIWSKRGKDDNHEDLRALLNAGYKRGATIPRCVGPKHDVVSFPVFSAVALAGLGELPDTIMSRSIIIRMRRRAPGEACEPFRTRTHESAGHALRDRLSEWAAGVSSIVGAAWPVLPTGIVDRPAEIWEPLIAVADAAGGSWPARAREACVALCRVAEDRRASLGVRLLGDLRTIFGDRDALHTEIILAALTSGQLLDADAPWSDLHGKPLGTRGLASILKQYGISPQKVTIGGVSLQGYRREHLWDAWTRYLPLSPGSARPELAELPEPASASSGNGSKSGNSAQDRASGTAGTGQTPPAATAIPAIPQVPLLRTPERASAGK